MQGRLRQIALTVVLFAAMISAGPTSRPSTSPTTKPIRKIVFVIDASGSTMPCLPAIKLEVEKAISGLKGDQKFTIYFFKDQVTMLSKVPMPATAEYKQEAVSFVRRMVSSGPGDPKQALVTAMKTSPDVIYFASDGDFPNGDVVVRDVRRQFAVGRVTINCCVANDRADNQDRMYQIAKLTGGRCFDLKGQPVVPQSPPGEESKPQPPPATGPSIFDP